MALDPWCLMGILNATPDSFSDGGDHLDPSAAADAGVAMVEAGAAILDIGGESTRPGAERVAAENQAARVVPVIRELRRRETTRSIVITIDTTLAEAHVKGGYPAVCETLGSDTATELALNSLEAQLVNPSGIQPVALALHNPESAHDYYS